MRLVGADMFSIGVSLHNAGGNIPHTLVFNVHSPKHATPALRNLHNRIEIFTLTAQAEGDVGASSRRLGPNDVGNGAA